MMIVQFIVFSLLLGMILESLGVNLPKHYLVWFIRGSAILGFCVAVPIYIKYKRAKNKTVERQKIELIPPMGCVIGVFAMGALVIIKLVKWVVGLF